MAKEIERKFLVDTAKMPDVGQLVGQEILQGYLAIASDSEVRLRNVDDSEYYETVKTAGDLVRGEFEVPLSRGQFTELWPATEGKRVEKTRYPIPTGDRVVELDVFKEALHGLVMAEVEFPDEATADSFVPLEYFGREVTADKRYKNQQLALHGIPVEEAA